MVGAKWRWWLYDVVGTARASFYFSRCDGGLWAIMTTGLEIFFLGWDALECFFLAFYPLSLGIPFYPLPLLQINFSSGTVLR